MAIPLSAIPDVVVGIQNRLSKDDLVLMTQTYRDHEVMGRIYTSEKAKVSHGTKLEYSAQILEQKNARWSGIDAIDTVAIPSLLKTFTVDWAHNDTYYGWHEDEMESIKDDAVRLHDFIKARRTDSMLSIAELMEEAFFQAIPTVAELGIKPLSLPYWLVYNATAGFNGGMPSGHTTVGGINTDTYTNAKCYTDSHAADFTRSGLRDKIWNAIMKLKFMPPVGLDKMYSRQDNRFAIYLDLATFKKLLDIAEDQNDNLGFNIFSNTGQIAFMSMPLVPIHALDSQTNGAGSNLVYGVDWSTWQVWRFGKLISETPPIRIPDKHRYWAVWMDMKLQFVCFNRARNFIIGNSGTAI